MLQDTTAKIGFFSDLVRGIKIRELKENKPSQEEMLRLNEIQKTTQQQLQTVVSLVPEVPVKKVSETRVSLSLLN